MDSKDSALEAVNRYDGTSFISTDHSRCEQPADNTCRPVFEPARDAGTSFQPLNLRYRDFKIEDRPATPLDPFHRFVPNFLVEEWVKYTNEFSTARIAEAKAQAQFGPNSRHWK